MHKWQYMGCICLVGLAALGAYFLPQMTSAYTDARTEGKVYTETMQEFAYGRQTETVQERSRRVMEGAKKIGMIWGDGQDVGTGDFRKRVKKEMQEMRAAGLLPDVFTWKWIGKAKNSMIAYYWNLNEDIEDFGDLGLWHIEVSKEDMVVELDMDAATYKIYHVSIHDYAKKLDGYQAPEREKWIKGFEAYYEFAPIETVKAVPNKALLWERDEHESEVYAYRFLVPYGMYDYKPAYAADKEGYHYVEGFSTIVDMHWKSEGWEMDADMTYGGVSYSR